MNEGMLAKTFVLNKDEKCIAELRTVMAGERFRLVVMILGIDEALGPKDVVFVHYDNVGDALTNHALAAEGMAPEGGRVLALPQNRW